MKIKIMETNPDKASSDFLSLITGEGNRTLLMQNLRAEALKYFFWVIDLRPGTEPTDCEMELFEICLPYINVVFDEFGDRKKRLIAEKIRELVLDKARDQIELCTRAVRQTLLQTVRYYAAQITECCRHGPFISLWCPLMISDIVDAGCLQIEGNDRRL